MKSLFRLLALLTVCLVLVLLVNKKIFISSDNGLKNDRIDINKKESLSVNSKSKSVDYNLIFSDIFNVSEQQKLVNKEILLKTIQFMIQEVDEFDPKLVEFVRDLIEKPNKKPRNLKNTNKKDFSQIGQSKYIDFILNEIRDGFFVEAGGYEGEFLSNSLFFELERNWTGLLIEPIPSLYKRILAKNRKIFAINACIAKKRPFVAKFKASDALSGRDSEMSQGHSNRIGQQFEIVYVPCFSLNTILKALNVKRVDYFSLDVEGGEWDVLTSLDLTNIDIVSFTIEHNGETERRDKMKDYLLKKNYNLTKMDFQDLYFLKNK